MTGSYVFWAVLGMIAYSVTTIVVKIASHEGLPSSVVVAISLLVDGRRASSIRVAAAFFVHTFRSVVFGCRHRIVSSGHVALPRP